MPQNPPFDDGKASFPPRLEFGSATQLPFRPTSHQLLSFPSQSGLAPAPRFVFSAGLRASPRFFRRKRFA